MWYLWSLWYCAIYLTTLVGGESSASGPPAPGSAGAGGSGAWWAAPACSSRPATPSPVRESGAAGQPGLCATEAGGHETEAATLRPGAALCAVEARAGKKRTVGGQVCYLYIYILWDLVRYIFFQDGASVARPPASRRDMARPGTPRAAHAERRRGQWRKPELASTWSWAPPWSGSCSGASSGPASSTTTSRWRSTVVSILQTTSVPRTRISTCLCPCWSRANTSRCLPTTATIRAPWGPTLGRCGPTRRRDPARTGTAQCSTGVPCTEPVLQDGGLRDGDHQEVALQAGLQPHQQPGHPGRPGVRQFVYLRVVIVIYSELHWPAMPGVTQIFTLVTLSWLSRVTVTQCLTFSRVQWWHLLVTSAIYIIVP